MTIFLYSVHPSLSSRWALWPRAPFPQLTGVTLSRPWMCHLPNWKSSPVSRICPQNRVQEFYSGSRDLLEFCPSSSLVEIPKSPTLNRGVLSLAPSMLQFTSHLHSHHPIGSENNSVRIRIQALEPRPASPSSARPPWLCPYGLREFSILWVGILFISLFILFQHLLFQFVIMSLWYTSIIMVVCCFFNIFLLSSTLQGDPGSSCVFSS